MDDRFKPTNQNNRQTQARSPQPEPPAIHIDNIMKRSSRDHSKSSIHALISGCQREAYEGRENEQGYCFELFRRALQDKDNQAWEAVEKQYWGLVSSWCYEYLKQELPIDEVDLFVRSALIRFWQTLSVRQQTLNEQFAHIGSLLKYLQQCTATVIHDHNRDLRRRDRLHDACTSISTGHDPRAFEDQVIDQMEQSDLVKRIANWVRVYVEDEREKLILKLSYEDGLAPRRIAELHPESFGSVKEVHHIKERVVRRLRRAMQAFN